MPGASENQPLLPQTQETRPPDPHLWGLPLSHPHPRSRWGAPLAHQAGAPWTSPGGRSFLGCSDDTQSSWRGNGGRRGPSPGHLQPPAPRAAPVPSVFAAGGNLGLLGPGLGGRLLVPQLQGKGGCWGGAHTEMPPGSHIPSLEGRHARAVLREAGRDWGLVRVFLQTASCARP